jgi:hypothetical protein
VPERDIRNGLGWDMRGAVRIAAAMALAMSAPSFFNLAYSPFRHVSLEAEKYVPFFSRSEQHDDIFAARIRAYRVDLREPMETRGTGLERFADIEEAIEPTLFRGETLPSCWVELGAIAWFDTITRDLEASGFAGPDKSLVAADLFTSHWLFGDLQPVKNGAPWYYGGLPGFENADYLLVPICPITFESRESILRDVEKAAIELTELRRTELYILFSIDHVPPVFSLVDEPAEGQ